MPNGLAKKRALMLFQEGRRYHQLGHFARAIRLYTQSIALHPTAESYTFRGGIYGNQGKIEQAISECKKAIEVDPTLGNPYNDIGYYLFSQGKMDEAEEWLTRAKKATRYDVRHSPYMNLGRLYTLKGLLGLAVREFELALEICPGEPSCTIALQHIKRILH